MRLKPNDSPDMELGEIRRATFKLSGVVGINSINSATITCPGLTIGTPTISGTSVEASITASSVGTHKVKAVANLSSTETVIGYVRVKVLDSSCETGGRLYD